MFYNPFTQASLVFFNHTPSNTNNFNRELINNVDLYYQPLQYPILGFVCLLIEIFILIIGELVHVRILKLLKHDLGLVRDILKTFIYIQMVFWPVAVFFDTSIDFVHPLREIVGPWYCEIVFAWTTCGMTYIIFHSLISGLLRYFFVVNFETVIKFGKEKTKKIFLRVYIFLPLLLTLYGYMVRKEVSSISAINKCNGIHYKTFLLENSIDSTAKRNFGFFENYDEEGSQYLVLAKKLCRATYSLLYIIIGSNLVEGILYWRTIKQANK